MDWATAVLDMSWVLRSRREETMIRVSTNAALAAALAIALGLGGAAASAFAQNYPTKPISLIIPFAPGGPADALGRNLAQAMVKPLKQPVIVENVAGAGGNIGVTRAARAAPNGYTILLHNIGMSTNPALYRTLQYNPLTDFEYIGEVADVPMTVIARGNLPANNLKEFLAYLKSNKDKPSYAHSGVGAASYLCGLLFVSAIQTEFTSVPYKSTGPAMNDLLGGRVDLLCDQTITTSGHIKSGKVKVIGVTTTTRIASLPDIPTLDEQGLTGFEVVVWWGVYAPKGTPKPALDRLVSALQDAIKDVDFRTNLANVGAEPVALNRATPDALGARLRTEIGKWGPIIKNTGQYAD